MNARKLFSPLLVGILLAFLPTVNAAFRRRNKWNQTTTGFDAYTEYEDDIPRVHSLVEMMGKELYSALNKPKYKFFVYMTIGTLPDERATIVLISTICNILYGISILAGFLFLKRGPMLVFSIVTLTIGPALVLILLGTLGMVLAAFALYPIPSVFVMISWFFFTSQLAQTLGQRWGLDSDQDGDVDWLDLLHCMSKTNLGESLGLGKLHSFLNDHQCKHDPFKEICRRLDRIHRNTQMKNNSKSPVLVSEEEESGDDLSDFGEAPVKKTL